MLIGVLHHAKIYNFGAKGYPNLPKWFPTSAPKAILEADRFQKWSFGAGGSIFLSHHEPIGRIRGALLGQLGAKGLPKSIGLAPNRSKISKNDVQGRVSEKA